MKLNSDKEISLGDFLFTSFENASKSRVKKMILNGTVQVNGVIVKDIRHLLKPGDEVSYQKFHPTGLENIVPFPVIYEDESLLVVEKPAGILTYGERGTPGTSVYKILLDFLKIRSDGKEKVFVVHRLDREVGGLLMFAKTEEIQEKIKENWKETEKKYKALVEGKPPQNEGTIKSWLKENSALKVYSVKESPDAKFAITHYKVVRELPEYTLLEVRLETGRKNQIRVQLSDIGCPVAGDVKYGAKNKEINELRLYATFLKFRHPVTGKWMEFKSRIPEGFIQFRKEE
jgi:23S rRNA pseudouridine1911/1915/1917 synthase